MFGSFILPGTIGTIGATVLPPLFIDVPLVTPVAVVLTIVVYVVIV